MNLLSSLISPLSQRTQAIVHIINQQRCLQRRRLFRNRIDSSWKWIFDKYIKYFYSQCGPARCAVDAERIRLWGNKALNKRNYQGQPHYINSSAYRLAILWHMHVGISIHAWATLVANASTIKSIFFSFSQTKVSSRQKKPHHLLRSLGRHSGYHACRDTRE